MRTDSRGYPLPNLDGIKYISEILFRDFEISAYNSNSKDNVLHTKNALKAKISEYIFLADKLREDTLDIIRRIFSKGTIGETMVYISDEDIFEKTPEDDKRLPLEEFRQLTLSNVDKLVELFISKNYSGEIIEFYPEHSLVYPEYSGIPKRMCEKMKAPKEYITLRDEVINSIYYRTDPDILKGTGAY
jgi:hypothetical protein